MQSKLYIVERNDSFSPFYRNGHIKDIQQLLIYDEDATIS